MFFYKKIKKHKKCFYHLWLTVLPSEFCNAVSTQKTRVTGQLGGGGGSFRFSPAA